MDEETRRSLADRFFHEAYRKQMNQELEEARLARLAEANGFGEIPTLRRDPHTGAYRPG